MVDSQTSTVYSTLALGIIVFSIVFIIFEVSRRKYLDVYTPNLQKGLATSNKIEPPNRAVGSWISQVWNVDDEEIVDFIGMDGYVYLRFLKMCFKIMLICGFISCAILIAVYGTSTADDDSIHGINFYSLTNIPSGDSRLWSAWGLVYVFTFIFLYYMYKEYENFAVRRAAYMVNVDPFIPVQTSYSVIVENVPHKYVTHEKLYRFFDGLFAGQVLSSSVAIDLRPLDKLIHYREELLAKLEQSIAKYEASDKTERPTVDFGSSTQKCCSKNRPMYSEADRDSTRFDAINFYNDQINIVNEEIVILQKEAEKAEYDMNYSLGVSSKKLPSVATEKKMNNNTYNAAGTGEDSKELVLAEEGRTVNGNPSNRLKNEIKDSSIKLKESLKNYPKIDKKLLKLVLNDDKDEISNRITMDNISHTGFVTFKSRRTQLVATQLTFLNGEFPKLSVTEAPPPSDIIWDNVDADAEKSARTTWIVSCFYTAGLLFWGLILTFVAGLSNLSTLASIMPFLNSLDTASYSILQGLLPVIVLIIFVALVPIIMNAVAIYVERKKTWSEVQMEVFEWFYAYQLANVYIILLAGSLINSATDIADNPTSGVSLVARAVPTTSVFFINFCITTLFISVPIGMLQLKSFFFYVVLRRCSDEKTLTRRNIVESILSPVQIDYGLVLPGALYMLTVGLLYWVIAPLVMIAVTLIFGATYLVMKYQYLYIFVRKFESGGKFWYGLYRFSMISLMVSTIIIIAYLCIKEGVIQGPTLVPLPIIIWYFWGYTEDQFRALSEVVPFSSALRVDMVQENKPVKEWEHFQADYYRQPSLKAAATVEPYPYRINGEPLITEEGAVNPIYYKDYDAVAAKNTGDEGNKALVDHDKMKINLNSSSSEQTAQTQNN
jgi:hypothetical protein